MRISIFQIDAFTKRLFGGNPAAVCPLDDWIPDTTMQAIATENNLSETAFFVPRNEDFEICWFTPVAEVDLAGHPTLATAYVILEILEPKRASVRFHTRKAGVLTAAGSGFASEPAAPWSLAGTGEAAGKMTTRGVGEAPGSGEPSGVGEADSAGRSVFARFTGRLVR